eukprot:1151496-Pelagomonas_calceolata.AAC.1
MCSSPCTHGVPSNLIRVEVGRSAWDRAQRQHQVGFGAGQRSQYYWWHQRKHPVKNSFGNVSMDFHSLSYSCLSPVSITVPGVFHFCRHPYH